MRLHTKELDPPKHGLFCIKCMHMNARSYGDTQQHTLKEGKASDIVKFKNTSKNTIFREIFAGRKGRPSWKIDKKFRLMNVSPDRLTPNEVALTFLAAFLEVLQMSIKNNIESFTNGTFSANKYSHGTR